MLSRRKFLAATGLGIGIAATGGIALANAGCHRGRVIPEPKLPIGKYSCSRKWHGFWLGGGDRHPLGVRLFEPVATPFGEMINRHEIVWHNHGEYFHPASWPFSNPPQVHCRRKFQRSFDGKHCCTIDKNELPPPATETISRLYLLDDFALSSFASTPNAYRISVHMNATDINGKLTVDFCKAEYLRTGKREWESRYWDWLTEKWTNTYHLTFCDL
jgi:hypothetical protein